MQEDMDKDMDFEENVEEETEDEKKSLEVCWNCGSMNINKQCKECKEFQ